MPLQRPYMRLKTSRSAGMNWCAIRNNMYAHCTLEATLRMFHVVKDKDEN